MSTRPPAAGPPNAATLSQSARPRPRLFLLCFCRAALLLVALPLSALIFCPSSTLACSLSWPAPTTPRFAPRATTVPEARRSLPRLAPSVRASPRGTACTGTLSCFAQSPNVAPVKGGFCGALALPGSIGPAACSAGTRCAAILAPAPPPVATYTCDKMPVPRRSPAAPALSASLYPPRLRPPYALILRRAVVHFVRSFTACWTQKRRSPAGLRRRKMERLPLWQVLPCALILSSQSTRPPQTHRRPLC